MSSKTTTNDDHYDHDLIDLFVGNANAQTSITNSNDEFVARVATMLDALPKELQGSVYIRSAYRSHEEQAYLYDLYKKGQGNLAAPPGRSNHNHGLAMDIEFRNDAARRWAHENAARFGLVFPIESEAWHVEPMGLRDGSFHDGKQRFTPGKTTLYGDPVVDDDHDHGGDFDGGLPGDTDEDIYGNVVEVNNHSAETQLLRVADMLMGGTFRAQRQLTRDPRELARKNLSGENLQ